MQSKRGHYIFIGIIIATCVMAFIGSYVIAEDKEQVIQISAKKFAYTPSEITVKKGVPVVLEFTSQDRLHGFSCPGLGVRSDIPPGKVTKLRFLPQKAGVFPFHCDNFCGIGHDKMTGSITVKE